MIQCTLQTEWVHCAVQLFHSASQCSILWELIDHIDVYEAEGTGKNRTQRICICYRFVGYLEVPVPNDVLLALDMRRGVRVNYTSKAV